MALARPRQASLAGHQSNYRHSLSRQPRAQIDRTTSQTPSRLLTAQIHQSDDVYRRRSPPTANRCESRRIDPAWQHDEGLDSPKTTSGPVAAIEEIAASGARKLTVCFMAEPRQSGQISGGSSERESTYWSVVGRLRPPDGRSELAHALTGATQADRPPGGSLSARPIPVPTPIATARSANTVSHGSSIRGRSARGSANRLMFMSSRHTVTASSWRSVRP
jgi:hypothetical protein